MSKGSARTSKLGLDSPVASSALVVLFREDAGGLASSIVSHLLDGEADDSTFWSRDSKLDLPMVCICLIQCKDLIV